MTGPLRSLDEMPLVRFLLRLIGWVVSHRRIALGIGVVGVLLALDFWLLPAGLTFLQFGTRAGAESMAPPLQGLDHPRHALETILHPTTRQQEQVRLQWAMAQLVLLGLFAAHRLGRRDRPAAPDPASHYGSHGSTRWRNGRELLATLDLKGPGLIVSRFPSGLRPRPLFHPNAAEQRRGGLNQNALVLGGSGAGKTRSLILPNLLCVQGESVIITDPKGELYDRTAHYLHGKGYEIRLINFLTMRHSDRYNPMAAIRTSTDAWDLARTFIENTSPPEGDHGDAFWRQAEEALLTALVLYVHHHRPPEERHLASVYEILTVLGKDQEALNRLFDELPNTSPARRAFGTFRLAEDKTRSGILIGLAARLSLWADAEVVSLTAAQDFALDSPGRRPMAVFLALQDSKSTYDVIAAMFFSQLFQALYNLAGESPGLRLPVPVRCFLDEWANIGHIPDFAKKISTMRSRAIRVVLVLQELGQIKKLYPRSWTTILGNCDTILYLGTNDLDTCRYFSEKLGHQTLAVHNIGNLATGGTGLSYIGRPLLTPDELQRFSRAEVILFQTGHYPARLPKLDYTDLPQAADPELADHRRHPGAHRSPPVITDTEALIASLPAGTGAKGVKGRPADPLGYLDSL